MILDHSGNNYSNPLERWLIRKAPTVIATRERFYIFQHQVKSIVESKIDSTQEINIASVPCGLLDDLLTIDFHNDVNVRFTAIDLDDLSLNIVKLNALHHNKTEQTQTLKRDAWNLKLNNNFDIILSNGLSIYEKDASRLIDLYKEFYKSLKKDGKLITR